jgi:hypothetical protein
MAGGALLLLLVVLVGGAAVGRIGPFGPAAAPPSASVPAKPADPGQLVTEAARRGATFKDVKYDFSGSVTNGGKAESFGGFNLGTKNPPVIDHKNTSGAGSPQEVITNLSEGVQCTISASGRERTAVAKGSAEAVDPLQPLRTTKATWSYLPDAEAGGRRYWRALGTEPAAPPAGGFPYPLSTLEVLVDPGTGKVARYTQHQKGTGPGGAAVEYTAIYLNFVYDAGVTIPECK